VGRKTLLSQYGLCVSVCTQNTKPDRLFIWPTVVLVLWLADAHITVLTAQRCQVNLENVSLVGPLRLLLLIQLSVLLD